ncbi:ABC transporter permease subunit [Haloferula sp. BvORR071]|uniref:ABC transporter permease n=1 Tax=Haloferula sp. BvORR071 TaxID=1396141 RepID=UPI000553CDF4|nr:ABC transporter permease subunit [Haloferula sp. BvORR071]
MSAWIAIFMDSFRHLKARKLFWITFSVSLLVALVYASIGFDEKGMSVFFGWKHFENPIVREGRPEAADFYVKIFTDLIVRFWLAWVALGLALVSTAGIFPDFIAEGSIGIPLSKPVGRLRLFLMKFTGALLFVALQVGVFTAAVFLAIGFRVGEWNFTVFWAVPLVTFIFALLFSVAVFLGVWTRSTLFSLLGAIAVWVISWFVHLMEDGLYAVAYTAPRSGISVDMKTGETRKTDEEQETASGMAKAHAALEAAGSPLPKTRDCTMYLSRLIKMKERDSLLSGISLDEAMAGRLRDPREREAQNEAAKRHSAWYVFGTSSIFAAVMLSLAAWIFCRRDY